MSSSILKKIAELYDPTPRDFDPEDIAPDFEASDSDVERDENRGREHYVDIRSVHPRLLLMVARAS